jgi:hypothetical protein
MCDPVQGELNSPGGAKFERLGCGRCRNPKRVASTGVHSGARLVEARRELIETLGRRWIRRVIVGSAKRVRGGREKSWSRLSRDGPGGVNPRGGAGDRRLKHPSITRHFRKV